MTGVVILCYRGEAYLRHCLDALAIQTRPPVEIIVVENASGDRAAGIAREHPLCPKVIENPTNLGCAGGNNVGWRAAKSPIILFLNPDCALEPDFIEVIENAFERDAKLGVAGGKLYFPNSRRIQHAGGILHPNAMTEHRGMGRVDNGEFDEIAEADYVTGAALAIRRDLLERLGGLDPEYFPAYYEETDLCVRARKCEYKICYIPNAIGYHKESSSVGSPRAASTWMAYRSRILFLIKNAGLSDWLFRIPSFEWNWIRKPYARGFRLLAVRSYLAGAAFALRCLVRLRRRPRGVRE